MLDRIRLVLLSLAAASVPLCATPAAAADTILIGLSVPDTGPAAAPAMWERWGVNLALDEINAAGGLLGKKVEILAADNRCNPSEAVNAANKLVEAKVVAIIGAHCSSATLATMPIIAKAKIPMVEGIATSPKIAELSGTGGNQWTFRINPSDTDMMDGLGRYLKENTKFRKIACLGEDTDFGRGGVTAFSKAAAVDGLTILSTDFYAQNQPDFTPVLTRLQQLHPDAIGLFQLTGDQLNTLRTAMQLGLHIPYTGRFDPGGANTPIVKAGGMDGSITAWFYSADIDTAQNKAFVAKIEAAHKMPPPLQTWGGYDSMRLIAAAITKAGSTDADKIRVALHDVDFTSVMGQPVKFDAQNQGGRVVVIEEISNRKASVKKIINLNR